MTEKNHGNGTCETCEGQFIDDQPFLKLGNPNLFAGKKGDSRLKNLYAIKKKDSRKEIKTTQNEFPVEFCSINCLLIFIEEAINKYNEIFPHSDNPVSVNPVTIISSSAGMAQAEIALV